MRILIFTLTLLLSLHIKGQSKKDYKRILKKEITIEDINENREEFDYNFQTIVFYNFDDIDYQIFMGPKGDFPVLAMKVLSIKTNPQTMDDKFTYEDLLNELKTFKESEEYPQLRKIVVARNIIANKHASIDNWETDEKLLTQMGFNQKQINEIYKVVKANQGKPYPEIFAEYLNTQQLKQDNINKTNTKSIDDKDLVKIKEVYAYKDYELGFK